LVVEQRDVMYGFRRVVGLQIAVRLPVDWRADGDGHIRLDVLG
jgi:hypothetical protein